MDPFWGTRSLALGTEVGVHVGRQDGPNLGARNPFYESAFRCAWGKNAGSHPSLVWVLGCGVGWGNGGRLFRIRHFQSKLGSHPWVGQQCVSLLQSPFGVKVLVGGVLRRCARSSRQGRWRVRRSIFLSRALFKHGHTVLVASLHACAERALLSPGVWGQSGHEFLTSLRQHLARIARSLVRRCVGDPARSFSVTLSSNESTSKTRLAPRVRLASQVFGCGFDLFNPGWQRPGPWGIQKRRPWGQILAPRCPIFGGQNGYQFRFQRTPFGTPKWVHIWYSFWVPLSVPCLTF